MSVRSLSSATHSKPKPPSGCQTRHEHRLFDLGVGLGFDLPGKPNSTAFAIASPLDATHDREAD